MEAIWKALLCSLLFYSRKNMKYDGAIVEYSKLETFYMVNFDLEEQTEPEKSSEHAGKQRGSGLFSCPGGRGVNLDLADICTAAAHKG